MLAKTKNTAIIAALTKVDIIAAQILSENGPALSVIASQCHLSQRERLLLKGRSLLGDAPPIHRERDDGRQHLGGPESVPDAGGAELAAEQPRQRHDEEDVAAEGDDQRGHALAQTFQRAGGGGGHRGHHEAETDDAQGRLADGDGLGVRGEEADEGRGGSHADDRARRHDDGAHAEGELVELRYPGVLLRAVVVADEGAHPLHDAADGQVKEGLELVVDAQHHHIALGEGGQQVVQEGDQQGGQGQIQDGRHADGIEASFQRGVGPQGLPAQMDGRLGGAVRHDDRAT